MIANGCQKLKGFVSEKRLVPPSDSWVRSSTQVLVNFKFFHLPFWFSNFLFLISVAETLKGLSDVLLISRGKNEARPSKQCSTTDWATSVQGNVWLGNTCMVAVYFVLQNVNPWQYLNNFVNDCAWSAGLVPGLAINICNKITILALYNSCCTKNKMRMVTCFWAVL